jgi:hypothetical protein
MKDILKNQRVFERSKSIGSGDNQRMVLGCCGVCWMRVSVLVETFVLQSPRTQNFCLFKRSFKRESLEDGCVQVASELRDTLRDETMLQSVDILDRCH